MKAVILAAGIGSRLRPLTDSMPKCMVEVNGVKIIENQLKSLIENKIEDILVVTGYKSDILEEYISTTFPNIKIMRNKDFLTTNNMYSLYLTKEFVKNKKFILMNADVFFDKIIIKKLLDDTRENLIVCDDNFYLEESMKIVKEGEEIKKISKQIDESDAYGTTIDVYKFSSDASNKLFEVVEEFIENKNLNSWTEVAIDKIFKNSKFQSLDIKNKWVEIDNLEDLKLAESLFIEEKNVEK